MANLKNTSEVIIKKSKFFGYLFELSDANEVKGILEELKKEHKKLTHLCYAYKVGSAQKYFDDGEPSGTAGRPIMNVIEKKNLDGVLICIVRFFGGIKLGTGGLVRAYNMAASELFK